jgi:hypothetical protein
MAHSLERFVDQVIEQDSSIPNAAFVQLGDRRRDPHIDGGWWWHRPRRCCDQRIDVGKVEERGSSV